MAEAILEQSDSLIDRVKEAVLPLDREVKVVKKDGTTEDYCIEKIVVAVNKSAKRVLVNLTAENFVEICNFVTSKINEMGTGSITMTEIHSIVECALQQIDPQVALSYRNYRNYKQDFVGMLDKVYQESQRIMYLGDKENSNIDSTLVATKRSLTYNELSKELYKKFFLNKAELQACNDGYIYVHDMSARLNTMNCFSADTRFITSQGMKSFNDFKDGDNVIVPTHDGSWQKAVVKCFGKQKLNKIVFKRGGKGEKTVRCTSNHRWLLKDGTETTNLKVGDKLILTPDMASFDWDTLTPEQKKLWVYGFCMADGFTTQNSENSWYSTIRLFGRKIEYAELFEDAGFTVTQPNCLDGALSVYIPRFRKETFEPSQISYEDMVYFVNGWLSADGNRSLGMNNSSPYRGIQVTGSANDYIYDILNMAGYFVTTVRDYTGQETNYGVRTQETKHYGFYSNQGCRGWVVQSIEPDQEEDVWCLVVENNHSFILENGIVTGNCCLFDIAEVLNGGFEMGNIWYNEPQTLDVAFDVIGDIVMSASSQQYGGFTLPEIDTVLVKYAEKSYNMYYEEALDLMSGDEMNDIEKLAHEYAMKKVQKDFEQGFQGWEYKFNTVGSSRGDYPFITVTSGLETNKFGIMCNKAMYKVRMNGQGKKGNKKPVLFPKIVFLYDKELHGEGGVLREVYDAGIACSQRAMYPDWLSMSGEGYIASMYKKYKKVISPMGCFKGDHVLGFMQQDNPFAQSIERTWDWLSSTVPVKTQIEGQPHKYIDVSNLNFKVWDTAKQDYVKVNTFIRNVQDNWVNVKLSNGRYLDVTSDHPFETENRGVVQAKDLVLGDKIKANYGAPTFTESGEINNSLAWLYGAMLCGGCYQNYSVFASFGVDEEDVIDKFIGAFQENYKLTPEVKLQKRGKKGTYYDVRVKSSFTRSLKSLINEFTSVFGGVQKIYRHIPSFIWSSNRENKLHFLAGMFDADGSIRYDDGLASLGSTNHELAYEQMYLIQSLGMPCKIRKNYYKGKQNSDNYRVAVDFYPTAEFIECLTSQKKVNNFAGEKHFKNTPDVVEVIGLDMVEGTDYAYDLSTESAHFEVNGVYSHNCRAFLSPWYERGGMEPADENDVPVFTGRFNIGAVSLHLPMIFMKAKEEGKDFYTVLDYYLEMIRGLHLRTYEYLGEMKASINPLAFCEGGFYGGHLGYQDKIKPILKSATASFGITALNELQRLYNGKSIYEDGKFTLEVMEYINKKVAEFKKIDGRLYAIYGTPAESLCEKQVYQFRDKYGIIKDVSDRLYVSNSFHCHVTEDITPIEKQNSERRFWELLNGGKIQYVKYPISYNTEAVQTLVDRAMELGFYEGVNLELSYCDDCGHEELNMDVCPKCGSRNLTKISRMNGYLSYSRVKGDTRLNKGKMAELAERKSM